MAWLIAKPKSKLAAEPDSRINGMRAAGIEPELPPNPASYLTDWLFEIGPTVPTGMGLAPIGWHDMQAWQGIAGVELLPIEGRILRRLSQDFIAMGDDARKPDCPPPWTGAPALNREAVSRKVGNAFKALVMKGR
ncbi:hypothetical protein [Sphingobium mellinum]|uniref:hypothetical protein n=1 Tax=Sphingobium mellinum TaxID=1387166 RepID=UPI0030ED26F8